MVNHAAYTLSTFQVNIQSIVFFNFQQQTYLSSAKRIAGRKRKAEKKTNEKKLNPPKITEIVTFFKDNRIKLE